MRPDPDAALGRLAVELLSGLPPDLDRGAEFAAGRGLGGLFAWGLSAGEADTAQLSEAARDILRRAARREAGDDMVVARVMADVLATLGRRGVHPVVLKGRPLAAAVWPQPAFRPAGDLDLLVEEESFDFAIETLAQAGYRRAHVERPSRFRAGPASLELVAAGGGPVVVDLHSRLFRSVGRGLDPRGVLERSRPCVLEGHPARELDEVDRLVFLLLHAAKHGARRLKWLLDLYAVALRADHECWRRAVRRAAACGAGRPFFAAASLVAALPGVSVDAGLLESVRPPLLIRRPLGALITRAGAIQEKPLSRWEVYALELLLEESLAARARMAGGVLVRLARRPGSDGT